VEGKIGGSFSIKIFKYSKNHIETMVKKSTISDGAYCLWKSKLRCETLEEFADRIHKMVFKDEKSK